VKKYLLTGVSRGIGLATAKKLLKQGDYVIGIARNAEQARKELQTYEGQFSLINFDLSEVDALDEKISSVIKEFGPLDGFVHCAGHNKLAPVYLTKTEDMKALWTIHALVPMRIVSILSKKKNTNPGASVVLLSSMSAHEGAKGNSAYASAKGAVEGYLCAAAAELAEKNIRINAVVLGLVETDMSSAWMERLGDEGETRVKNSYPFGIGKTEDAAGIIRWLLSEESAWITGQKITADGGHSCRMV